MHAEGSPVDTRYDTAGLAAPDRSRHWEAAVGNTYFSLQLQFQLRSLAGWAARCRCRDWPRRRCATGG